jgi:predicted DNA-binding helix-hairpin-helix protein
MLLLKVPECVYVLEIACQSFLVVLFFFLKSGFSFFMLADCCYVIRSEVPNLNRGASASSAKLQVGRISKYFRKYIQTLFLSLSSVLKGWSSFFLSSFLFADMLLDMEIAIT